MSQTRWKESREDAYWRQSVSSYLSRAEGWKQAKCNVSAYNRPVTGVGSQFLGESPVIFEA
ncbi:hypothetical protein M407DRAFT_25459 [Tulasnella calospora MUT 4182]|uniref:Uncharacterized protein n=1 Tax=Tulasnella calospora MUT 4182 TaxID=1051891 RepID=A0A0C3QHJ4_9AGAM|nr:hypothetical protein M407DRAFT_25459 [Tulasnella calospora MUT 4182]